MEMTGGEAVASALEMLGVRHVFGIVSVHNLPIYDAIGRRGTITPVGVRHEQAAAHAADGYARATGELGVVIASTGPGTTNTMTGLFEAGFASSPVLLITGQIESRYLGKARGVLHEAENQRLMLSSLCRRVETVRRTEDIGRAVIATAEDIRAGRPQPGAVEIPIDQQYRRAEVQIPSPRTEAAYRPDPRALSKVADALGAATRPVLWAGGGVVSSGAGPALVALAERLGAPVVTSVEGRGSIPEDHPLCLGALTTSPPVEEVVSDADLVLAVGTRFQGGGTRNWRLPLRGTLAHLDADPAVIGRNYPADLPVVGDARIGLELLLESLDRVSTDPGHAEKARSAADAARAEARTRLGEDHCQIMDAIRRHTPRDCAIVRDATVPAYVWGDRLLPVLQARTSLRPASAAIGPGLPLALGAAAGSGRPAVLIAGDGGFMLHVGELATAAQHGLPVVICLFNDRGYGVLRNIEADQFDGRNFGVDLTTPDFPALARAMGVPAIQVTGPAEFEQRFREAIASGGPALLDIDLLALTPLAYPAPRPGPRPGRSESKHSAPGSRDVSWPGPPR
ncbi:MAG TPA: thiamine pyrophosphate-binding protein [Trebonia sp.]|nr:thiamine pyrophosphate-binding protein [Trebonia sp.]